MDSGPFRSYLGCMQRLIVVGLFFGNLVPAVAAPADALWDRAVEGLRRGRSLTAAEARVEGTAAALGQDRRFAAVATVAVVDGRLLREVRPVVRPGVDGDTAVPEGKAEGASKRLRAFLYGWDELRFEEAADLEVRRRDGIRRIGEEPAVRYSISWTAEDGYGFTGDAWVSAERGILLLTEVSLARRPRESPLRELRMTTVFTEASGLPVRGSQSLEAVLRKNILVSARLRAKTVFDGYIKHTEKED